MGMGWGPSRMSEDEYRRRALECAALPKILSTECNCSAWRKYGLRLGDYAVMFGDAAVIATQTEADQEM